MTEQQRTAELAEPYALADEQITRFREQGFIKLKNVFSAAALEKYGQAISQATYEKNPNRDKPLEQRDTYGKAFIQVSNLWETDDTIRQFAHSAKLAKIATDLLGTRGVRLWHDQALYKEPGGGFTPWHVDQQYWPMTSSLSVTAWIPLQATPIELGPLCFGKGSHLKNIGRDLAISDESEKQIRDAIKREGLIEVQEPYQLGEVSFHYGWTLHRAGPNSSEKAREVFTVIYMDEAMRLSNPKNENQTSDWHRWTPSTKVGEVMNDPRNPVLFRYDD